MGYSRGVSWLDPVFGLAIGVLIAACANRRWVGALVGFGAVVMVRPVLGLTHEAPWLAVLAMAAGGLVLALFARGALAGGRDGDLFRRVVGGAGGLALGTTLVLATVISLPIQRSPFDPNQLYYPPRDLPPIVQDAVLNSWAVGVGRDVLLFPLLDAQRSVPDGRRDVVQALHRWLVIGEPWRRGGAGS